jgi:hypothetical protein
MRRCGGYGRRGTGPKQSRNAQSTSIARILAATHRRFVLDGYSRARAPSQLKLRLQLQLQL